MITQSTVLQLDQLLNLERLFPNSERYTEQELIDFINSPECLTLSDIYGNEVRGWAVVTFRSKSMSAYLESICSVNRGGYALLATLEQNVKWRRRNSIFLDVEENNHKAIAFFKRAGYYKFGKCKNFYPNGHNSLRFRKELGTLPRFR